MAINTRRTTLKGIDNVIAEYKAKHGAFRPGKVYEIEYVNGYDESGVCEVPVDTDDATPEKSILDAWEDYVADDDWEYDGNDLETIDSAVEIVETGSTYQEWLEENIRLMKMMNGCKGC